MAAALVPQDSQADDEEGDEEMVVDENQDLAVGQVRLIFGRLQVHVCILP